MDSRAERHSTNTGANTITVATKANGKAQANHKSTSSFSSQQFEALYLQFLSQGFSKEQALLQAESYVASSQATRNF